MRKILLLIIIAICLGACSEKEIVKYENETTYLFFRDNPLKDSIVTSFVFFKEDEISVPIVLKSGGRLVYEDIPFNISIDTEGTTLPAVCYDLPENNVFHKGDDKDSIYIKLIYDEILDDGYKALMLDIAPGEGYEIGPLGYRKAKIYITNKMTAPEWWTVLDQNGNFNIATRYYVGKYSEKKYTLLLDILDGVYLDGYDRVQLRTYALKLKYYVKEWNEANFPEVMMDEENNEPMTIPVAG